MKKIRKWGDKDKNKCVSGVRKENKTNGARVEGEGQEDIGIIQLENE